MIDARPDDFAWRNQLLQAVLGVLSLRERLDHVVDVPAATALPEDDDVALAFLGFVAFTERLRGVLDGVAAPAPAPADPPAEVTLGSLLR